MRKYISDNTSILLSIKLTTANLLPLFVETALIHFSVKLFCGCCCHWLLEN